MTGVDARRHQPPIMEPRGSGGTNQPLIYRAVAPKWRNIMHRCVANLLFVATVLLLAGCGGENGGGQLSPLPGIGGDGIAYDVSIEGEIDPDLHDKLEAASQLIVLREQPPASLAALRRRVTGDVEGLASLLRAEGYYGGVVQPETDLESDPVRVILTISPGVRYAVTKYDVVLVGSHAGAEPKPPDDREFGFVEGMPARGEDIIAIEQALLDHLQRTGRPKAVVADRKAVVEHDTAEMTVTLQVDPGPRAVFGPLELKGLNNVEEDYIRNIIEWPEGEQWDRRELDAVRRELANTNLFRTVNVEATETVDGQGRLPVTAVVEESKHRTLAAGVNYSTDEKLGGELSWEHRNFFGRQERLRLSIEGSAIRRQITADFRKPQFLSRDLTFVANLTGLAQNTNAYDERTGAGFAGLEKLLAEIWRSGVGLSAEYSQIEDDGVRSTYAIVGIPIYVSRDGSNDLLDPTEGTRVRLSATPYRATIEQDVNFTVFEAEASAYVGLGEDDRVVPAIRLKAGSITGADTLDIPITKRFFAGGGGSIRGYEYQMAGPLDANGDPIGGRSLLETGFELRWRVTDSIGIVPFVEGGNVYDKQTPDLGEDLFWAVGMGFRYFTIAGPLRIDIAFPLNRREGIDDEFQFYVSVGQAF
jgi:translocation and assembly module TamA